MKNKASALEEGKADILGLHMVTRLHQRGELSDSDLMGQPCDVLAPSIRFGASSAHGIANLVRFNFFREQGALSRDNASGSYRVNFEAMQRSVNALSEKILRLQGAGDYEGVTQLFTDMGEIGPSLPYDQNTHAARQ